MVDGDPKTYPEALGPCAALAPKLKPPEEGVEATVELLPKLNDGCAGIVGALEVDAVVVGLDLDRSKENPEVV